MGAPFIELENRCRMAALGSYPWDALLRDIGIWVGGTKAMMLGAEVTGHHTSSLEWNHDPRGLQLYNSHYNRFDPRKAYSRLTPKHGCQLGQEYVRNSEIAGSEYFQVINVESNVFDSVHGIISDDAELGRRSISVQREFGQEFFAAEEKARLSLLLPALEDALRDSIRVARTLAGQLAGSNFVYLVLDAGRNVVMMDNGLSASFDAAPELQFANGKLASSSDLLNCSLENAVRNAAAGHRFDLAIGAKSMSFSPVPAPLSWLDHGSCAFVCVTGAATQIPPSLLLFAQAHGFSDRERDLLVVLARTGAAREAAGEAGLKYETMRWHTKNMLMKSGFTKRESMIAAALSGQIG